MNKTRSLKLLLEVFTTFFKVGSFTFGGGYAMIPLIEREVVQNKKWVAAEEIVDILAVAQSMPGAIAINSATFIGNKLAGRKGGIVATVGVVMPSFLIITLIAIFFTKVQNTPIVAAVFSGIRPTVVGLISIAAIKVAKTSIIDSLGIILVILSVLLVVIADVPAFYIIIGGAAVGLTIYRMFPKRANKILSNRGNKK
ncbi:MAG: chromate transporter [Tepidanaerobacteraceae bacterium]|jgi:chromate transporter|nr:chromate transporter [Thermoanaerobacterales bacterium]